MPSRSRGAPEPSSRGSRFLRAAPHPPKAILSRKQDGSTDSRHGSIRLRLPYRGCLRPFPSLSPRQRRIPQRANRRPPRREGNLGQGSLPPAVGVPQRAPKPPESRPPSLFEASGSGHREPTHGVARRGLPGKLGPRISAPAAAAPVERALRRGARIRPHSPRATTTPSRCLQLCSPRDPSRPRRGWARSCSRCKRSR